MPSITSQVFTSHFRFWGMAIRLEHNNDVLMNSVTINLHGRFGADKLPVQWRVEKNYTKMFVGAKYNFMA